MEKVGAAGRSIIRLSYVLALVAAVAVAVLAGFYESQRRAVFRQGARSDVLSQLSVIRSDLQGAIDADLQVLRGLVAVVESEPGIGQERFARLGAKLIRERTEIRGITGAPGLVTSLVHPLEDRGAVLGLDLRSIPSQFQTVLLARERGTTVFIGPVDLLAGGRGFVARAPVFTDDHPGGGFWGTVSIVIDEDAFYRASGLTRQGMRVEVVLSARDDPGANEQPFFGEPAALSQDPVTTRVALPLGAWEIAAIPRGGWPEPTGIWLLRGLFLLAGLLVVVPILGAARLVTSRQARLAETRAREAELSRLSWRLEFALAASNVGVWDVDLKTDELLWDDRARALFGFPDREGFFSEADWTSVLHPDDRERVVAEANRAVAENGRFVTEYRVVRADGSIRHVRDKAAVYQGDDGSRRLVGLIWDITPDIERQEELSLRRREAEGATLAKSRFLAAMSHEIRTPMGGVLGLLGLMLDEPLPPKQRERARVALGSAQSLLQILNDILDFSKLEANQIRVSEESVRIRQLVAEVMELMAAGSAQKGLALIHQVADTVPEWIVTDPMRLRQILTNLLSNATKFTEEGRVTVRVGYAPSASGGDLRVEVEDTGIGIAEEHRGRIFHDFVQADNSLTRRAGGTGLGLAISKQLVELMGGTIAVRSVPGEGSRFDFTIHAPPGAAPAAGPAPPAEPRASGAVPPMRILLAEDNATNQYLINAYLRAGGHEVMVVTNGSDAVAAAGAGGFDAILMDVQMPKLDGLAAARAIRALPGRAAEVPIIALTANAMSGDREDCLAAGMTDYLSKPIDVPALQRALLRARPAGRNDVAGDDGRTPASVG
jgi:PAS domain S-box-containing protein